MQSEQNSTIEFVRPGRATHAWVARTVAELKGGDPLSPVTLVVPNYYAGRQIRWTLAAAGGYVNVRSMLLGDLAEQVVYLRGRRARQFPARPCRGRSWRRHVVDPISRGRARG